MKTWPKSWETPRTHQSELGLLLNTAAAAEKMGLTPLAFAHRVTRRRIWSNGKPLTSTPPFPQRTSFLKADGTNGKETTFLLSDVERADTIGSRRAHRNKTPPPPPSDGINREEAVKLLREAAKLAGASPDAVRHWFSIDAIREWCGWDPHPLLGRKLNWGIAKNGSGRRVKLSRADIVLISEILNYPLNRKIPGNAGRWLQEGIYRYPDLKLAFTDQYLFEQYGIHKSQLCLLRKNGQLHYQEVIWPSRWMTRQSGKLPGTVIVNDDEDVQKILCRRGRSVTAAKEPKTEEWLARYKIWRNPDGLWFSSTWIAERVGKTLSQVHNWQRDGLLTRTRKVQREFVAKKGGAGGPVLVTHDDEVRALLGEPTKSTTSQGADGATANGAPQHHASGAVPPAQLAKASPRRKTGIAKDQTTWQMYVECKLRLDRGDSARAVKNYLKRGFSDRAPEDEKHVYTYRTRANAALDKGDIHIDSNGRVLIIR